MDPKTGRYETTRPHEAPGCPETSGVPETPGARRRTERVTERQVRDACAAVAELVGRLEPAALLASEASGIWGVFDEVERLAAGAKTLLAPAIDASREWARRGHRSAAEYLAQRAGTSVAAAKQTLETARALDTLEATAQAVRDGSVSATQAAAITAAAAADPAAESRLLALAPQTSVAALRAECLRTKAAADPDPDATHRRIHRERSLREHVDGEGAWNLVARGPAALGARVHAALEPIIDDAFRVRRPERADHEGREAYAFDALVALADRGDRPDEAFLRSAGTTTGPSPAHQAATGAAHDPSRPARPRRTPYRTIVRVDLAALARGRAVAGETCEIAGLGPVPASTVRSLLGESVCHLVITKGTDVAHVTHLGRGPTAAQRVALAWAQPTCTVSGCVRTRVEIDHRDEWSAIGETRLGGLDPLCAHHHRLKTHDDWALVAGTGDRPMVPPTDPRHPAPRRGSRGPRGSRGRAGTRRRRSPPPTAAACGAVGDQRE